MNTKKKTLSVLTMAATALLFAACDKDEVGEVGFEQFTTITLS